MVSPAFGFGYFKGALNGGFLTRYDHLPIRIIIGGLANITLRCFLGHLSSSGKIKTEQCGHGPGANRSCRLHGLATNF